jgi:hypothetical protein
MSDEFNMQANAPFGVDRGESLLRVIQQESASLPTKSLFVLAISGLRVRLMRSVVTMISVVLAIAFLTYTGLANKTTYNLAKAVRRMERTAPVAGQVGGLDDEVEQQRRSAAELRTLLRYAGVNVATTLRGDPLDRWLIVMALLTCTVGIANAMLMSVTERFREIGTMKCLGAQDNLVIKLFLIESGVVGLAGAVIGIALGISVALLSAGLQFKGYGMSHFPVVDGLSVVGLSLLAGCALATIGAVYPAIIAARMRPVDALRTDE